MLTYFGINPELTTTIMQLVFIQARALFVIIWCRYLTKLYVDHMKMTAGEQYRQHVKSGGYRC